VGVSEKKHNKIRLAFRGTPKREEIEAKRRSS
jgi:hypothetical protein